MNTPSYGKRLANVRTMSGVAQLSPAAFPGSHCPMHTALSLAVRTGGISSIVIGTPECSRYSRNVLRSAVGRGRALHWTYILDSREVVFGCRKGLTNAILEMDRAGARAILLISTCIPELIGEDIESLCGELQPRVNAVLMSVSLGNFKCGGYEPGNWKTLLAFRALIARDCPKDGSVNVMGRGREDHGPLPRLMSHLEDAGVRLRYLGAASDLEDFQAAGRARLNLILSPFYEPLGDWMEGELGIPAVPLHALYRADDILQAFRKINGILSVDLAPDCSRDHDEVLRLEAELAALPKGTFISAMIGAVRPLPLAEYLAGLGLSPMMIHLPEFYPGDGKWRERLLRQDENPLICLMLNPESDRPILQSLHPDIVLDDKPFPDGAPRTVRVSDLYALCGFERSGLLLRRLISARKEASSHGTL